MVFYLALLEYLAVLEHCMICLCVGKYWDKRVGGVGDLWGSSVVAESEVVFWGGPAYYATPYGGRSALGMHFNTRRTLLSSRRDLWQALPDTGLSESRETRGSEIGTHQETASPWLVSTMLP